VLLPRQQVTLARGAKDKEHAMSSKLNTAIAVAGIDIGKNSFHVEAEDVKGTVAALDFAIAVIGTVPPVEDFNDLDPMPDQCITQGRSIRWRWVRCLIRQSMANEETTVSASAMLLRTLLEAARPSVIAAVFDTGFTKSCCSWGAHRS
jgi:hypothetical protein